MMRPKNDGYGIVVRLCCVNDRNGNPRRLLVILHTGSRDVIDAFAEGYLGEAGALQKAGYTRTYADMTVNVAPAEFRRWTKHAAFRRVE